MHIVLKEYNYKIRIAGAKGKVHGVVMQVGDAHEQQKYRKLYGE